MTRRAYFLYAYRVIRRQPGASLKFYKKWHLGDFYPTKCWVWEIATVVWLCSIFSPSVMLFWCGFHISNLRSIVSRWLKVRTFAIIIDKKIEKIMIKMMKKWSIPNSSRIIPGRFLELQNIKKHEKQQISMKKTIKN